MRSRIDWQAISHSMTYQHRASAQDGSESLLWTTAWGIMRGQIDALCVLRTILGPEVDDHFHIGVRGLCQRSYQMIESAMVRSISNL